MEVFDIVERSCRWAAPWAGGIADLRLPMPDRLDSRELHRCRTRTGPERGRPGPLVPQTTPFATLRDVPPRGKALRMNCWAWGKGAGRNVLDVFLAFESATVPEDHDLSQSPISSKNATSAATCAPSLPSLW